MHYVKSVLNSIYENRFIVLFIAIIFEIWCCVNLVFATDLVAILYLLSGIVVGVIPLLKSSYPTENQFIRKFSISRQWAILFFVVVSIIFGVVCYYLFSTKPLDYRIADMLPIIQIMAERFLNGDAVYAIIPEIWGGMQPVYLPAMWLPYTVPVGLNIDIRWINMVLILTTLGLILLAAIKVKTKKINSLIFFPILLVLFGISFSEINFLLYTEEPVVVFFYILLSYGLFRKNTLLIILGIALCVASRYALLPWLLVYGVIMFFLYSKSKAISTTLGTIVLLILLMLCAEAYNEIDTFLNLQNGYLISLSETPFYHKDGIDKSIGLARLFPYEQLKTLHYLFLIISICMPFLLLGLYYRFKDFINKPFILICSLKISLVFFFSFLVIPFMYLFYTSVFLSILIFSFYSKHLVYGNK